MLSDDPGFLVGMLSEDEARKTRDSRVWCDCLDYAVLEGLIGEAPTRGKSWAFIYAPVRRQFSFRYFIPLYSLFNSIDFALPTGQSALCIVVGYDISLCPDQSGPWQRRRGLVSSSRHVL